MPGERSGAGLRRPPEAVPRTRVEVVRGALSMMSTPPEVMLFIFALSGKDRVQFKCRPDVESDCPSAVRDVRRPINPGATDPAGVPVAPIPSGGRGQAKRPAGSEPHAHDCPTAFVRRSLMVGTVDRQPWLACRQDPSTPSMSTRSCVRHGMILAFGRSLPNQINGSYLLTSRGRSPAAAARPPAGLA